MITLSSAQSREHSIVAYQQVIKPVTVVSQGIADRTSRARDMCHLQDYKVINPVTVVSQGIAGRKSRYRDMCHGQGYHFTVVSVGIAGRIEQTGICGTDKAQKLLVSLGIGGIRSQGKASIHCHCPSCALFTGQLVTACNYFTYISPQNQGNYCSI